MANLRLTPLERLFWREFEALLHDSLADGRRMPLPLAEEWQRGVNRFARPGEILIAAWADRRLIGCGGCNGSRPRRRGHRPRAPAYVHRHLRRRGIGRALLERVLDDAGEHLRMLTVHAPDAGAARFYERCGFDRAPGLPITHVRSLARRP